MIQLADGRPVLRVKYPVVVPEGPQNFFFGSVLGAINFPPYAELFLSKSPISVRCLRCQAMIMPWQLHVEHFTPYALVLETGERIEIGSSSLPCCLQLDCIMALRNYIRQHAGCSPSSPHIIVNSGILRLDPNDIALLRRCGAVEIVPLAQPVAQQLQ